MNPREAKPYWNSYLSGVALGVLLFLSFWITGNGLGSSGGVQRVLAFVLDLFAPTHVDQTPYWAKLAGGDKNPLNNWLVIEIVGSSWKHARGRVSRTRHAGSWHLAAA
jgi:hypothetical protein